MAPTRLVGIDVDVRALMGEVDEGLWHEEGLFERWILWGQRTNTLTHSSFAPTSPLARSLSRITSEAPSFSDFLPGLTDTIPEVEKLSSVSSLRAEARDVGNSGARRKVVRTVLSPGKSRRQWKANKVVKQYGFRV
jgi:hypothetical protein